MATASILFAFHAANLLCRPGLIRRSLYPSGKFLCLFSNLLALTSQARPCCRKVGYLMLGIIPLVARLLATAA